MSILKLLENPNISVDDRLSAAIGEIEMLREILGDIWNYPHKTDDVLRWCRCGLSDAVQPIPPIPEGWSETDWINHLEDKGEYPFYPRVVKMEEL